MKHKGAVVSHLCNISNSKLVVTLQTQRPCRSEDGHYGKVCVNDETYCDSIEMPSPQNEEYILVTSSTIQGFESGWSEGVTKIINELSENLKKCLYESYFSSDGMGYKHIRLPIGSNGFDTLSWAYNERSENDTLLTNFTKLDGWDLMRNGQFRELARITNNQDIKFIGAVVLRDG